MNSFNGKANGRKSWFAANGFGPQPVTVSGDRLPIAYTSLLLLVEMAKKSAEQAPVGRFRPWLSKPRLRSRSCGMLQTKASPPPAIYEALHPGYHEQCFTPSFAGVPDRSLLQPDANIC